MATTESTNTTADDEPSVEVDERHAEATGRDIGVGWDILKEVRKTFSEDDVEEMRVIPSTLQGMCDYNIHAPVSLSVLERALPETAEVREMLAYNTGGARVKVRFSE